MVIIYPLATLRSNHDLVPSWVAVLKDFTKLHLFMTRDHSERKNIQRSIFTDLQRQWEPTFAYAYGKGEKEPIAISYCHWDVHKQNFIHR